MIYALMFKTEYDDKAYIMDVTENAGRAADWAARGDDHITAAHEPATQWERALLVELDAWLLKNYDKGAHWVYETTSEAAHLIALREVGGDLDAYQRQLKKDWALQNEMQANCY